MNFQQQLIQIEGFGQLGVLRLFRLDSGTGHVADQPGQGFPRPAQGFKPYSGFRTQIHLVEGGNFPQKRVKRRTQKTFHLSRGQRGPQGSRQNGSGTCLMPEGLVDGQSRFKNSRSCRSRFVRTAKNEFGHAFVAHAQWRVKTEGCGIGARFFFGAAIALFAIRHGKGLRTAEQGGEQGAQGQADGRKKRDDSRGKPRVLWNG